MGTGEGSAVDTPIIGPGHTFATVTDKISSIVLQRTRAGWYIGFAIAFRDPVKLGTEENA